LTLGRFVPVVTVAFGGFGAAAFGFCQLAHELDLAFESIDFC
jgi:hypothetical protein